MSKMIVLTVASNEELIKNILDAEAITTSFRDTGYLPTRKEIKNRKIGGIIINAVTNISYEATFSLIFHLNKLFTTLLEFL